tara:strand:+ start:11096 stop:11992 length:897 start_codon:yes stop_codon:yes gene_type:complete
MNELTTEFKDRIVEVIKNHSFKFTTDKAHAIKLGIDPAQFSRVLKGEREGVLSEKNWMLIASVYNVPDNPQIFNWQTGYTAVYDYITKQLEACQSMGISGIFCDLADIGKSHAAKDYVSRHRNAIRVDCSLNKSRTELLRAMAREFGIYDGGSVRVLQKDLIQYMTSCTTPMVILDEFGDLSYPALLETKALWNATEFKCGWYMMGADGLQKKLDLGRDNKKVGYAELWRRFGSKYQRITPKSAQELHRFLLHEISQILKANDSRYTPLQMYKKTGGSLTRLYFEIKKEKTGITAISA